MRIIVIGGSAGAIPVLMDILSGIPTDINAAIFIVIHFPEDKESQLPGILAKYTPLVISHAGNNNKIKKGCIYIAPPGFHLLIKKGQMLLSRGPKENRFRPSVDVLFRSAAVTYGYNVTGVILSGALDDGTAGLSAIKKLGGITVVQHPDDAFINGMPLSAMKNVAVDYCIPAAQIGRILQSIASQKQKHIKMNKDAIVEWENAYAEGKMFELKAIMAKADSTRYICPLCEGPLFKPHDKDVLHYRCFTGHAFSAKTLLKETSNKMEHLLWTAYRTLDEKKEMLKNIITDKNELKRLEQKINSQLKTLLLLRQSNEDENVHPVQ